jgi:hypothetical protein
VLGTLAGFGGLELEDPSPTLQNDDVQRQAVTPRDVLRKKITILNMLIESLVWHF